MSERASLMQIGVSFYICGAIWGTDRDRTFWLPSILMTITGILFFIFSLFV